MRLFPALLLMALPAMALEYVRVSPRDHRYLELSSGAPYIPIGLNMAAERDMERAAFESWVRWLAANRGNHFRIRCGMWSRGSAGGTH